MRDAKWQPTSNAETHNTETRILLSNSACNAPHPLTWPGREFDQTGTAPSVEQGHCTLIAVKRYRDPPRIGGRHNFLLRPLRSSLNKKRRKRKKLCSTKFFLFCTDPAFDGFVRTLNPFSDPVLVKRCAKRLLITYLAGPLG